MQEQDKSTRSSGRNVLLAVVAAFFILILCGAVGAGGYLLGRSNAPATIAEPVIETETIVETVEVEVTREVTVVATPAAEQETAALEESSGVIEEAEAAGEEAAQPPSGPTAEPPPAPTEAPTVTPQPLDAITRPEVREGELDFSTFYEVWDIVDEEFDGEVPANDERVFSAIAGSLEALDDDFTRFVPPDIAARMREDMSGSVSGIGAFVRENDDGLVEIVRPIDGQPADLAGLRQGDVIIEVDGESVVDESFDAVLLLVRGPEGSEVTLTVQREGEEEPLEFTIVRTLFEIPVVEAEMLEENGQSVGYLRLTTFSRNAEEATLGALTELLAEDPAGLIFDLRDNGGGFLDQSVAVADIFLPSGVVLFERSSNGIDETFFSDDGDIGESIPLVVLVNAGTASASEIVAGAIQDRDRGVVIGEQTFGKGSVQNVHTLSDGSELRVTIARWYTPNDISIDAAGVTPDIEEPSPEDLGGELDQQIQRALEFLTSDES